MATDPKNVSQGGSPMNPKETVQEIIFEHKNKEYGAYILRKFYPKHVSVAIFIAVFLFSTSVSMPIIIRYLTPAPPPLEKRTITLDYTQLSEPPSIDKKQEQQKVEIEEQDLRQTIKFLPPVIKPDDQVKDEEEIPDLEELKEAQPDVKTQEGDPNAMNVTDLDFEVKDIPEEKVIEEVKKPVEQAEVFTFVEEMPSFPGGEGSLMAFLQSNVVYPEIAKRAGVEGKVYVTFIVEPNGQITSVRIARGIGAGCDEEAVRVVAQMPGWSPGKQNGNPVRVQVSIPIIFKLTSN